LVTDASLSNLGGQFAVLRRMLGCGRENCRDKNPRDKLVASVMVAIDLLGVAKF